MRRLSVVLLMLLLAATAQSADQGAAKESYRQGNSLFDQNRFADAAAAYSGAIEQDPQFLEAYYNRALADEMVDRQKAHGGVASVRATCCERPGLPISGGPGQRQNPDPGVAARPIPTPCSPRTTCRRHRTTLARSRKPRNRGSGTRFPSRFRLATCRRPTGRKERGRRSASGRRCFRWN